MRGLCCEGRSSPDSRHRHEEEEREAHGDRGVGEDECHAHDHVHITKTLHTLRDFDVRPKFLERVRRALEYSSTLRCKRACYFLSSAQENIYSRASEMNILKTEDNGLLKCSQMVHLNNVGPCTY